MGDRLAIVDMGRKEGGCGAAPFFWGGGELGPHLTQCGLGRSPPQYQVASVQPFGHNRHGPKIGVCAPLGDSWVPI